MDGPLVRIWHSIFILVLKLVRDTFTYCIVGWGHRKWHRSILRRKPFFWLRCCHHRFLNRHLHQFTMAFHSFNGWSLSCIGISSLIDFNMVVRFVDVYHLRMICYLCRFYFLLFHSFYYGYQNYRFLLGLRLYLFDILT